MDYGKLLPALEYRLTAFAGVMARVVVAKSPKGEPSRDIESLPLASLGDFVRGRISAFEPRSPRGRRRVDRRCRDMEGLFESVLSEAYHG
jgi:hypothetical protein